MTKVYTYEDIPNTLNSISWQLKRIADQLEFICENSQQEKIIDIHKQISKLREMAMKNHEL